MRLNQPIQDNEQFQGIIRGNGDNKQSIEIIIKQNEVSEMEEIKERFTFKELMQIFIKKIWIIILCILIGTGIASFITVEWIEPTYDSYVSFYVNNKKNIGEDQVREEDIRLAQKLVSTYIEVLQSNIIIDEVIQTVNLGYDRDAIKKMLKIIPVGDTGIFKVRVRSNNAEHSASIARSIGEVASKELINIIQAGDVKIIDQAEVSLKPSSPHLIINIIIGILLGSTISCGGIFIYSILDNRVKNKKDLEKLTEVPCLAIIPHIEGDKIYR